ncbi:MAG: hypothetical protein JSW49_08530 [candidate division WOR-3 bacterium]|nr:MAG: hypothetical protein JSW49_08530 [candidate division WOR-3 bacterium]
MPFTKKEVRFARRFPFVVSTTEITLTKIDTKAYAKVIEEQFPIPAERRPIAVMPFKNLTGDTSFDYLSEAIPNLLITNLEQSKYLSVMTWERMHDLLEILGKEEIKTINDKLGFELCKLDGVDNIVLGCFTKAGNMFATDLKILDVSSKQLLKTANSKAKGIDSILETQIDELSSVISQGVGLSLSLIDKSGLHISDVTTSSIEAYSYYLEGKEAFEKFYHEKARELLEKAIQIDPAFAAAYYILALINRYAGNTKTFKELFEKAMQLSENISEKEKLWIRSRYAHEIEGDVDKQIKILKILLSKYPKEKNAHCWLGIAYRTKYMLNEALKEYEKELILYPNDSEIWNYISFDNADLGNYAKAIECIEKYKKLSPDNANAYDSAGEIYFQIGNLDKAISNLKLALKIEPKMYRTNLKLSYIYAFQENYEEMNNLLKQEQEKVTFAGSLAHVYMWYGFYNYWLGSLEKALEYLLSAEKFYKTVENAGGLSCVELMRAWIYFEKKKYRKSRTFFREALKYRIKVSPKRQYFLKAYLNCWLCYVDITKKQLPLAKQKMTKIRQYTSKCDDPRDKSEIEYQLGILDDEMCIAEKSLGKNINAKREIPYRFKKTYLIAIDEFFGLRYILPYIKDISARMYLVNGNLDKAINQYEQIVRFGTENNDRRLIHPKYHFRLAKLYEEKSLNDKAVFEYEKFLNLWKNADEDRTEKIDAKKRLAELKAKT